MNCKFLHIPSGARLNSLLPDNVTGLKILKRKCACGSSFVKIIWKPLSLKMSIYLIKNKVIRQCFLQEIVREQRDAEADNC